MYLVKRENVLSRVESDGLFLVGPEVSSILAPYDLVRPPGRELVCPIPYYLGYDVRTFPGPC